MGSADSGESDKVLMRYQCFLNELFFCLVEYLFVLLVIGGCPEVHPEFSKKRDGRQRSSMREIKSRDPPMEGKDPSASTPNLRFQD